MKYLGLVAICLLLAPAANADWKQWLESALEPPGQSADSASVSGFDSTLTNDQVIQGLKEALQVGVEKAIARLGREGGYLKDAQVRIPLPGTLQMVAKGLRAMGQAGVVDAFEVTINRAAERAVAKTLSIFTDTLRNMSLADARAILNGGDSAATDYFRAHSSDRLRAAMLPIVSDATARAGVTSAYKALIAEAGFLGSYMDRETLDLDRYVTAKALDGVFLKLAQEERLIRKDPVARTTDILKTVFGHVGKY